MISLTKRQRDIIFYFIENKKFFTIEEIATKFNVSKRTVQYEIEHINSFLNEKFPNTYIQGVRNKGLELHINISKENIIKETISSIQTRFLGQPERIVAIKLLLLLDQVKSLDEIADYCLVSKKTIINDYKLVEKELNEAKLILENNTLIKGNEIDIRDCFESVINDYDSESDYSFFKETVDTSLANQIKRAKSLINKISEGLKQRYIVTSNFLYCLAYVFFRIENNYLIGNKEIEKLKKSICKSSNNNLLSLLKEEVSENDAFYFASLFLRTKLYSSSSRKEKDSVEKLMADYLIQELKHLIKSKNITDSFRQLLELHLKVAIYRMKNNIEIKNDFLENIKLSIPLMYEFTKETIKKCEKKFNLRFDETEIAYIAMHIASAYENNVQLDTSLDVLIVCSFGLATSSLLKSRISQLISSCTFIGPISEKEAKEYLTRNSVDLIITTHDYDDKEIPSVKVNPLLSVDDINSVNQILSQISYRKSCNYFLESYKHYEPNIVKIKLRDYVEKDMIQVIDECSSWQIAIQTCSRPLLKRNMIEEKYVDKMIQSVKELGNYMIITPETAFVHAGSDDGINESCLAILILKNPILFGEKYPELIRNIVVLGMKSKEDNYLLNIINLFGDTDNLKQLKSSNLKVEDVYYLEYMKEVE